MEGSKDTPMQEETSSTGDQRKLKVKSIDGQVIELNVKSNVSIYPMLFS